MLKNLLLPMIDHFVVASSIDNCLSDAEKPLISWILIDLCRVLRPTNGHTYNLDHHALRIIPRLAQQAIPMMINVPLPHYIKQRRKRTF
jgi:hypothetical protein